MALTDIPRDDQPRRLDSWKEIAEYLRRDVRTATRWEAQGLPLHRVPGGKGRSVFAFTDEIDAWLAGNPVEKDSLQAPEPAPASRPLRRLAVAAVGFTAIAIGIAVMWPREDAPVDTVGLRVAASTNGISILDDSGESRMILRFAPGAVLAQRTFARAEDLDADGAPEVLAAVSYYDRQDGLAIRSGEVMDLETSGSVRWKFAFDDEIAFSSGTVSGPWSVVDWQVERVAAPARVAVAAHDYRWWASLVAMLDHNGRRLGTFVNPGWVESLLWRSNDQLAIAGFNNVRDEAMFAVLDAGRLEGQAPGSVGTPFDCLTCASSSTAPLLYATFARSELNKLTAGRFNRASLSTAGDQILVTTIEVDRENVGDAAAIYEFDRDLRFVRARYSDTYWDEHRRLEAEGRLTHSRDACPDRDGPAAIHLWDPAGGWTRTTSSGGL